MKRVHLTLAPWWALMLFAAGCGERPPVSIDDTPAPAAVETPAPPAPVPAAAAPAPPPSPISLHVTFDLGLVKDMEAAFQQDPEASYFELGGADFFSGQGKDYAWLKLSAAVGTPFEEPAGSGMSLMFGGVRTGYTDSAGPPGTAYYLARTLFDAMKVPDQKTWGRVTRVSPGSRVHCTSSNDNAEISCYLTGVLASGFYCGTCP